MINLFKKKLRLNKYLVNLESGKNKINNQELHVQKYSCVIDAKDETFADTKAYNTFKHTCYHFGHAPDYLIVTNIIKL